MAILASQIITEAQSALLNDPSGAIYPSVSLVPILAKVYRELQNKLAAEGVSVLKEIYLNVKVVAGQVALVEGFGVTALPPGMLYPNQLFERPYGATTTFAPMTEKDWEPDLPRTEALRYWAWREDEVKFLGATTDREVKIRGVKGRATITDATNQIEILNSEQWLAQRLAAVASLTIGSNPTRASALQADLGQIWDDLILTHIKRKQASPVRRRRTKYRAP